MRSMLLRPRSLWLVALVGCPWVSADEHADNQAAWLADGEPAGTGDTGDTDTDVDTDTDTDTDVDTDTDTDTDIDCTDDTLEDNDVEDDAAFVPNDYPIEATLCPDDGGDYGEAADTFGVVTGAEELVTAVLQAKDCSDVSVRVEVLSDGEITAWTRARGVCPTITGGGYGNVNSVVRIVSESNRPLDYTLTVSALACGDADTDSYLDAACGGPDCNDADAAVRPGAVEVESDGQDQDCDGGDKLAVCGSAPPAPTAEADTLQCGDLVSGQVWDRWVVDSVPDGSCLEVRVDNLGDSEADPLVRVRDRLSSGRDFDNEVVCASEPWTTSQLFPFDQQCPGGGVRQERSGEVEIWVAQVPDVGAVFCPTDAPYGLVVEVDGDLVVPSLDGDDIAFQ